MEDFDYLLSKELEGRLDTLLNGLSRGAPNDYPEYCKLVGEFRGVRYALDALKTLRQQRIAEEDV
jgi:hypothetical protein